MPAANAVSRTAIIALRVLLLLAAAAALALALRATRSTPTASYVCPMHPEARASSPGDCPICGMALELFSRATAEAGAKAEREPVSFSLPPNAPEPSKYDWGWVRRQPVAERARAAAWVDGPGKIVARMSARQVADLTPGARGRFVPIGTAGEGAEVRATAVSPSPRAERPSTVQFEVVGARSGLRPKQIGWVELPARARAVLVVPTSAVLDTPEGPFVLTGAPGLRTFTRRPVALGTSAQGIAVIDSGVTEGEQVVTAGAFVLEAERERQWQAASPGSASPGFLGSGP